MKDDLTFAISAPNGLNTRRGRIARSPPLALTRVQQFQINVVVIAPTRDVAAEDGLNASDVEDAAGAILSCRVSERVEVATKFVRVNDADETLRREMILTVRSLTLSHSLPNAFQTRRVHRSGDDNGDGGGGGGRDGGGGRNNLLPRIVAPLPVAPIRALNALCGVKFV